MAKRTGKSKQLRRRVKQLELKLWAAHQRRCTPEQEAAIEAALDDTAISNA